MNLIGNQLVVCVNNVVVALSMILFLLKFSFHRTNLFCIFLLILFFHIKNVLQGDTSGDYKRALLAVVGA